MLHIIAAQVNARWNPQTRIALDMAEDSVDETGGRLFCKRPLPRFCELDCEGKMF